MPVSASIADAGKTPNVVSVAGRNGQPVSSAGYVAGLCVSNSRAGNAAGFTESNVMALGLETRCYPGTLCLLTEGNVTAVLGL